MNQDFSNKLDPLTTQTQGPDLQYYWQLFKDAVSKYYIGIGIFAILTTAVAAMFVQTLEPTYYANAQLHVKPRGENVFNLTEVFFEWRDPAFQETQMAIITSQEVLVKAAKELNETKSEKEIENTLNAKPANLSLVARIKLWFNGLLGATSPPLEVNDLSDAEILDIQADDIRSKISILPVGDSYLLQLTVKDTNSYLAAETANIVAEKYVESVHEKDLSDSTQSQEWLMDRMTTLREELRVAEQNLQLYREQEDILVNGESQNSQSDVELITSSLLSVRETRMSLENQNSQIIQIEQSNSRDYTSIPAVASHPLVQTITREVFDLERSNNELQKRYGPKHNKMIAIESQLASAREALRVQSRAVVETIRNDYDIAQKNEKSLSDSLDLARQGQQSLGRKEFQLRDLASEVASKREIYDVVLTRFNQTNAGSNTKNNNIYVADRAIVPRFASSSKQKYLIYAAFIASVLGGLALAILAEALDSNINTPADVELKLNVEALGTLPKIDSEKSDDSLNIAYNHYQDNHHSIFSESVRTIRTSLILSSLESTKKRILVTSSVPGEGKTSVALNLATAFGESEKVLLIDGDLRRPSLDKALNLRTHEHYGLTDLIAGTAKLEECLVKSKDDSIDILTAGTFSRRPLDIFGSERFSRLLTLLDNQYDRIVIDTAPVSPVSDALLLSTQVDSLLYVVKAGKTAIPQARRAIQKLQRIDAPISGIILNKVDESSSYYEYEYYGHGYSGVKTDINQKG